MGSKKCGVLTTYLLNLMLCNSYKTQLHNAISANVCVRRKGRTWGSRWVQRNSTAIKHKRKQWKPGPFSPPSLVPGNKARTDLRACQWYKQQSPTHKVLGL